MNQVGNFGPVTWAKLQTAPTAAATKPATSTTKPKATSTTSTTKH